MDFDRESSPPPAYTEQDYDKKLASAIELSLISEQAEREGLDESRSNVAPVSSRAQRPYSTRNHSAQIHPPSSAATRAARRLPLPPTASDKPLRVHTRSSSHAYGSSPVSNTPKPSSKWHEASAVEDISSMMDLSRISAPHNRAHLSASPPPVFSAVPSYNPSPSTASRYANSSLPQHPFSGPTNSTPSRRGAHTRTVSQLNFDSSVAYSRTDISPVSAGSNHSRREGETSHLTFNPNSFYNSAVSSQMHGSIPAQLNKPNVHVSRSIPTTNNHYTQARPAQDTWSRAAPALAPVPIPQRAQSPYSPNATQFPLHPSYKPTTPTGSIHDRWATSENQYVHT